MSPTPHTPSSHTGSSNDPASASPAAVAAARAKIENPSPDLAEAMARGYEPKDIGLRGIFIFLGTLVVSLIVVLFLIWGILSGLLSIERSGEPAASPVTILKGPQYAPLQPSGDHGLDTTDMNAMRYKTASILHGSGTVQSEGGVRRYQPIEKAMDQAVPLIESLKAKTTTRPS